MGERRCVCVDSAHCHDNLAHMGRADDETVIHVPSNIDDTIISVPDDSTIITVPDDATVTPEYNTLISAMLDNSVVGADDTIITVDEVTRGTLSGGIQLAGDVAATAPIGSEWGDLGDSGDTAPIVRFQLRENNGTKHALGRPIVVGRLPQAPRTGRGAVELLVVPSPNGQVSSTHAMIEALGDVVVVTDLRSTNGTRVNNAGRPSVLLAPGDSLTVGAGAVIDVGDGNRLEVLSLS
jgi:hypothetical protein